MAQLFSDDFERSDSTTLGSDWTEHNTSGNGLAITSGRLQCSSQTFATSNGWARWGTNTDSDDMFCEWVVGPRSGNSGLGGLVRATSTGFPTVYGQISNSGAWEIGTRASNGSSAVVRASGSTSTVENDTIRLEAEGTEYRLYKNGSLLGTWDDTGGAHTIGSSNRRLGMRLITTSSGSGNYVSAHGWAGGDIFTAHTANASRSVTATRTAAADYAAKTDDLVDDFSTANLSVWTGLDSGWVSGGKLNFASPNQVLSTNRFALYGSKLKAKIDFSGSGGDFFLLGVFNPDAHAAVSFYVFLNAGDIDAIHPTGIWSGPTYNATNHKWIQLRDNGTTTYIEASPTGIDGSWSTLGSFATDPGATRLAHIYLGGQNASFDQVNGLAGVAHTASCSLAITATRTAVASRRQNLSASLTLTAARTGAATRGHNAATSLAVTATRTGQAFKGAVAAASLALTASRPGVMSRGQSMSASLGVDATESGVGREDGVADANLFLNGVFSASGLKTLNGVATLSITASQTAVGTESSVGDSGLSVTAARPAAASHGSNIGGSLSVTATPSAVASRGQSVGGSLGLTADPSDGDAFTSIGMNSNLVLVANRFASVQKGRNAAASLGITVSTGVSGTEGGVADALLALTATRPAAASRAQILSGSLIAAAAAIADVTHEMNAQASLALSVNTWVMFQEPREVIEIEPDDRSVEVLATETVAVVVTAPRTASVEAPSRHAEALEGDRSTVLVAEGRSAAVGAEDRHVMVPDDLKTAIV